MGMSNQYKLRILSKALTGDVIQMILMASGFVFDIDAHDGYADISASELANGNGYTTGGLTLTGIAFAADDVNDRADATWNDAVWTAAGGSIGPSPSAVMFDDTETTPIIDINIGDIPFAGDQTANDGGTFTVTGPTVRISI